MAESQSEVTAIVVTYNSAHVLGTCLDALTIDGMPVIVVDNASADNTVVLAEQHGASVLHAPFNEGYGRANNRGIEASQGACWCLILNPDLLVEPDTVTRLLALAQNDPRAGLVVPEIVEHDGRIFDHETSLLSPIAPPLPSPAPAGQSTAREVAFASGACMLVRRTVFRELGGFDENIFLFYEDDDLCLRVRRAGWKILKASDVYVHHTRGTSAAPKPGHSYLVRYHQAWSRCYVARKHSVGARTPSFVLLQALKAFAAIATFNRRRIERHGGSLAGIWACLRGRRAFANEGEV